MASEQAMALYRKLNSGAITSNNWREWERLASSAMKMPDFTPAGQSESLHDLANEVGIEIQALKSRASRPGAKAKFKVEDRFYFGKGRKERFWASGYDNAKERVRRSAELGKYAKIIMQPEFDSADHWDWVATASIGEIVNWAKSIARNI